jgi:predicted phage terminase large subunit-like protein
MCQGNPHVPAGEIIKRAWWKFTDRLPGGYLHVVQIWDTGYTESKGSSYSVCGTFALMPGAVLIVQWFREKLEWTRLLPQVYLQYKRAVDAGLVVNAVKVEPKASGISLVQAVITGQGRAPTWPQVPITLLPAPVQDKVLRAQSVTGYMQAGWVQVLREARYTYDLIEECAQFPNGQYNDQVDVLVHGLRYLLMGVGQDEDVVLIDDTQEGMPPISEGLDEADEYGFGVV